MRLTEIKRFSAVAVHRGCERVKHSGAFLEPVLVSRARHLYICPPPCIRANQSTEQKQSHQKGQTPWRRETRAEIMKTTVLVLSAAMALSACGGGASNYASRGAIAPTQLYATGPIQRACMSQGRKAASSSRCGCVQAVADRELSSAQQRRSVKAFKYPNKMQEWRQSDRSSDNAFWDVWKAFGNRAAKTCS